MKQRGARWIMVALALLWPAGVSADVIFSFGPTRLIAPISVSPSDFDELDPVAFTETAACDVSDLQVNFTSPGTWGAGGFVVDACGPDTIGGTVTSHWVVSRLPLDGEVVEDILVFDAPILGVQTEGGCVDMDSGACRSSRINYNGLGSQGLGLTNAEGDTVILTDDRRFLYYRFVAYGDGDWDGMRVFTERAPDAATDLSLSCGRLSQGEGLAALTFTTENLGPVDAPGASLLLRLASGGTLAGTPPGCALVGSVLRCVPSAPVLVGGPWELEVPITTDGSRLAYAAIVRSEISDPDTSNNICRDDVNRVDGGVGPYPDGGPLPTGMDAGTGGPPGLTPPTFAGGGGCVCRAAPGRGHRGGWLLVALAALVLYRKRCSGPDGV